MYSIVKKMVLWVVDKKVEIFGENIEEYGEMQRKARGVKGKQWWVR